MDGRLYLINGERLGHLLKTDLPELTLALVGFQRKLCNVWRVDRPVTYFRLFSPDLRVDVRVRGDDWAKIEPYLRSGAWNPDIAPVPQVGYLHPSLAFQIPFLPETDKFLYTRILDDLEKEFPKDYPTSQL